SRGFDMVAMNVQIELFCQKYNIESKRVNYIQLILEELILEVSSENTKDLQLKIDFTIEYSEEREEILISFNYEGSFFNPFELKDSKDHLGIVLISGIAKNFGHNFENGRNTININI
ncbi:MAG: hypothetical protein Q8S04_05730, partial [Bacteroidales bacterium]|nr:hypothetical protein [Bacteroidales bacterium]